MTDTHPDSSALRRVRMPDGAWWTVEFRHEMTHLARRGRERERELYIFFRNERGALRRATVTDAFKASANDDDFRDAWTRATVLDAGDALRRSTY